MPATATAPIEVRTGDNGTAAFPADRFVAIPNVMVFAEHQTKARDGRPLTFGRDELQAVANRCNRRIDETGDYSTITIGHTPDPTKGGGKDPPVVGYAGPFRVQAIKSRPGQPARYAIFADFHVFADKVDLLRQYPRRSPELWLESTYDEMILDPIALLGSELPRLDMGMLYAAEFHGRRREKYTAVAPSGSNAFLPDSPSPRKYEAGDMLAPEDVRQIVEAIGQTPWAQWCQQKMQEEQGAAAGMDGAPGAGAAPPPPAADPGAAGPPSAPPPEEPEKMGAQRYESGGGGPAPAAGSLDRPGPDPSATGYAPGLPTSKPQPYSRQAYDAMQAEMAALRDQIDVERAQRVNSERRSALQALAADGVRLDVESEMKRLCYGRMRNDSDFAAARTVIAENYQRDALGMDLPDGGFRLVAEEESGRQAEHYARTKQGPYQYTAKQRELAKARCLAAADRGEHLSYDATLAEIASRTA